MSHRAQPMMRFAVLSIAVAAALLAAIWASPSGGASAQPVPNVSLSIAKSCVTPKAAVGGLVMFSFTLINNGDVTLDRDSVIDPLLNTPDISSSFPDPLAPGQVAQVTKFYIVQEDDPRPLVNTVTASYHAADGTVAVSQSTCSVDVPHLTITKTATFNPTTTTLTFEITNDGNGDLVRVSVIDTVLGDISDQFPQFLDEGDTVVVQITVAGEICENTVTAIYESGITTVTATAECGRDERSRLEVRQNNPDGTLFTDDVVTFHICSGDVVLAGCVPASPTFLLSTPNPSGFILLDPGTYTVCVVEPAGFVVDPPSCQAPVVVLGATVSVVFITRPENGGGEGCTPGFWRNARNGRQLWDEASDAIPQAIGAALGIDPAVVAAIDPASDYYLVFMVGPGTQGLPDPFTTDDAIRIGGGHQKKLARHGMAALLNAAAVNFPLGITEVKNAVQAALLSGNFEPLATQLNDFNNLSSDCPVD